MIMGKRIVCDGPCGRTLTRSQTHFLELTGGWTKARTAGGTNAVVNPKWSGKVLCELCFVETQVRGEQGALF